MSNRKGRASRWDDPGFAADMLHGRKNAQPPSKAERAYLRSLGIEPVTKAPKAGRPSKADLERREQLKAQAAEDDSLRAEIEAAIARGEDMSGILFRAPPPSSRPAAQ